MISITRVNSASKTEFFEKLKIRNSEADTKIIAAVSDIIENVKNNGDKAVKEYTEKFDSFSPESFLVEKADIEKALAECDPKLIDALKNAAENISDFHKCQAQQSFMNTLPDGSVVGQRIRGLDKVGVYVPGGTAAYPSSVLMNVIPAKIAGVKEIIMVTPPSKDGANRNILAAAAIAGVDKVFLCGGAQAVAALAFGTQSIPKVDKIVGPGNIYVATAKKLLFGTVDIDMIAGPSEILIIADDTANASFIAADLLSQAEHDVLASAVLLTNSEKLADDVIKELENQLEMLPRKEFARQSLRDFGAVVICESIDEAVETANLYAPEHLEMCVMNPFEYLGRIDNAGSVFLGNYAPEALGDYYAGPNHVLPTSGTARFFSPLSVDSFIKKSGFIYYTEEALKKACSDIETIAEAEGLHAHANAAAIRFQGGFD